MTSTPADFGHRQGLHKDKPRLERGRVLFLYALGDGPPAQACCNRRRDRITNALQFASARCRVQSGPPNRLRQTTSRPADIGHRQGLYPKRQSSNRLAFFFGAQRVSNRSGQGLHKDKPRLERGRVFWTFLPPPDGAMSITVAGRPTNCCSTSTHNRTAGGTARRIRRR